MESLTHNQWFRSRESVDATVRVRYAQGGLPDRVVRRTLPPGEAFRIHNPSSPDATSVEVILERKAELQQVLAESGDELRGLVSGYSVLLSSSDIRTKCSPLANRRCQSVSFEYCGSDPPDEEVRRRLSSLGVVLDHIGDGGGIGSTVRILYFWLDGKLDREALAGTIGELYGPRQVEFWSKW